MIDVTRYPFANSVSRCHFAIGLIEQRCSCAHSEHVGDVDLGAGQGVVGRVQLFLCSVHEM